MGKGIQTYFCWARKKVLAELSVPAVMRKNRTSGSHGDVNFPTPWNPPNFYRRGTAESSGMAFRFGRNATAPRVTKRFGLWWTAFLWKMSWNVDRKRLRSKIKGPSHMKRLTTLGCKWSKDTSEKIGSLLICQSLEACLVHYVQLSLNQKVAKLDFAGPNTEWKPVSQRSIDINFHMSSTIPPSLQRKRHVARITCGNSKHWLSKNS